MDSRKDPRAASAGDILITRLMRRGGAGVVTDGGFRDAATIGGLDIPAYHHRPSSPTNLTLHEAIDMNVPIGCGDVAVFPGDVVAGDQDSVIVIPAQIADEAANEAVREVRVIAMENLPDEAVRHVGPVEVAGVDMIDTEPARFLQDGLGLVGVFRLSEDMRSSKLHDTVAHPVHRDRSAGEGEAAAVATPPASAGGSSRL